MNTIKLANDIQLTCVRATSFPKGVKDAHEQLHKLFPVDGRTRFFGVSWMEEGQIVYLAGADATMPSVIDYPTEPKTITKGSYASVFIPDFMLNLGAIGQTFDKLLKLPNLDQNGYCLEWYVNQTEMYCMVPLTD